MVLNNRDLNQVTWEERVQLGDGKTESTQSIPDFPYHKYAELLGLKGIFVDDPEKFGAAWDEALAADRPVILECYTDPNVPPLAAAHHAEGREELHDHDAQRAGTRQRVEEQRQAAVGRSSCRVARTEPCDRTRRSNGLCAQAYTIPTDFPEADGTASWTSTTIIVVHAEAAGRAALAIPMPTLRLQRWSVTSCGGGRRADAMNPPAAWRAMQVAVRNLGARARGDRDLRRRYRSLGSESRPVRPPLALCSAAIAKPSRSTAAAALPAMTITSLRANSPVGWKGRCRWVKMKIGRDPDRDPHASRQRKRR